MFAENFVPAQWQRFRLIDRRGGFQLALPNHLARQLFDIYARIRLFRVAVVRVSLVFVVGLDRNRRRVPGEEARGDANPRDVHREQTKPPRPGAMLLGREIFEVEPRRDLFEDEVVRLRAFELERFLRRQPGCRHYAIFRAEREIPFQGHGIAFDGRTEFLRHRRHRNPTRYVFGRYFGRKSFGELNDNSAADDAVAFRGDARDRERLHHADDDFLSLGQRRLPLGRGQARFDDQLPIVSRWERFRCRDEEHVLAWSPGLFLLSCRRLLFQIARRWLLSPRCEDAIIALVTWEGALANLCVVGLDPGVDFRARAVGEPEEFRATGGVHISIEENEETRSRRGVIWIVAAERGRALNPQRRRLHGFAQVRLYLAARRVLECAAQRDLVLRGERQDSFRHESSAAGAKPDELAFHRRRKNQRRSGGRLSKLVGCHHLGGEAKLECARRLEAARRQQELNGAFLGQGRGGETENQREPDWSDHLGGRG